ncbi:N-acylhomoserine lactone synthase [Oxalobacteraceae bacterium CAVE-383]|nr:N-acylhomoserine lactone synthase [Oxalobacteraceae bacterium CAVE-383]
MAHFSAGTVKEWSPHIYPELLRYRHRIFVDELGWDIPSGEGMESDQFDRDDTVHVVARDSAGEVSAYSRLLPTVKPYLLAEIFPQLMDGQSLPCAEDTWELSRFTARNSEGTQASRNFVFSPVAIELLHFSVSAAAGRGARNLIFAASPGMVKLGLRADLDIRRLGRSRMIGGHRLMAGMIRI